MYIYDLVGGSEQNLTYQNLAIENLDRQYTFLRSLVDASLALKRDMVSIELFLSLNHHAISCLHASAGQLRPCSVTVGHYEPPPHYQVPALMNMFVDEVNRKWESVDPVFLSAFVLWKLNHIHPFVNGNGRTARAACYFILCMKLGKWIEGNPVLPELIRRYRADYIAALETATNSAKVGTPDLSELHGLLERLLDEQGRQVRP